MLYLISHIIVFAPEECCFMKKFNIDIFFRPNRVVVHGANSVDVIFTLGTMNLIDVYVSM